MELLGLSRVQDCTSAVDHLDLMSVSHTAKSRIAKQVPCSECLKVAMGKRMPSCGSMKIGSEGNNPFPKCGQKKHAERRAIAYHCFLYRKFWSLISQRCSEALVEFTQVKAEDRIVP